MRAFTNCPVLVSVVCKVAYNWTVSWQVISIAKSFSRHVGYKPNEKSSRLKDKF